MRSLVVITLVALLCGCSSKARFNAEMRQRYEAQCDKYFSAYASSDIEGAKKALSSIINLSLAEKAKARHYWRFNVQIAFSEARLALIAERQSHEEDAAQLFAYASDHMMAQDRAFRAEMQGIWSTHSEEETIASTEPRWSPDQWRKAITTLDAQFNVQWNAPNKSADTNGNPLSR